MRSIFAANIAEAINNAKVFVVKGELAVSMADMASTKKYYTQVQQQNSILIEEYTKRRNNHEELKNLLRELNGFINKAASIRMGEQKQRVVQQCRAAVKDLANRSQDILNLLEKGAP